MYIDTFCDSPIFFELFDSFQFIYQSMAKNPAKIRLSRHCVRKMLEGRNHACRKPTNGIVKPPKPSGFGGKSGTGVHNGLFKLGVEVAMMNNILAATHNIDADTMESLRRYCTEEVATIGGKYKFEDAVKYQQW